MAEARTRHEWRRTSWVLAMLANVREALSMSPRSEPWTADDFDPFADGSRDQPARRLTVSPEAFWPRFHREERATWPVDPPPAGENGKE